MIGFDLPQLSLLERDQRWAAVRAKMAEADLDCLVLFGWPLMWDFYTANARYLSPIGGNAAVNILVFPLAGEPTSITISPVTQPYWAIAQQWVSDIRVRQGSWADSIFSRIAELKLTTGRIGFDGMASALDPDGWIPHGVYTRLEHLLPRAQLVSIGDFMEIIRAIKSDEELQFLRYAAKLGDSMLAVCGEVAREGVTECAVFGAMREVMLAEGGEEPTLALWAADPHPFPHPFHLPRNRKLNRGDLIVCELHPKFSGYCTHVERTFSLGPPKLDHARIFDGCIAAYETGLREFGPGKSISASMRAVKQTIEEHGLKICETGIHGHGLGSLEYPRYRHHAISADAGAVQDFGDTFQKGMVFAFNIDLYDPAWRNGETGCVFAETIEITDDGLRRMHTFPTHLNEIG